MSKGSRPRPFSIKPDEFAANWDRVFGKERTEAREGHLAIDEAKPAAASQQEFSGGEEAGDICAGPVG
jgi:hypothetical protein